jgi:dihydrofolate synthase/folylpolyglutamate synthase
MKFQTLQEWLAWQETLHPSEIELGLERIRRVLDKLHPEPPGFKLITVGGTNGKGSSVAMLEAIYLAAGYRVGSYTSPHLLRYNERIRLDGEEVGDQALVAAFERVDQARGQVSLTYFEFGTLAAIDLFYRIPLDVVILEVGMGGRLDAVNILDADVALVTNVDLDHTAWLGKDREAIGFEKAGIYRPGRPAIFNDAEPPKRLREHAEAIGAKLWLLDRDYGFEVQANQWRFRHGEVQRTALPMPALRGAFQVKNAAGVVMAVEALNTALPVNPAQLRQGLLSARVPGRMQVLDGPCEVLLDVAHNPHAAGVLAQTLMRQPPKGRCYAVVGMLADKDIPAILRQLCTLVDVWLPAGLEVPRGATALAMASALSDACGEVRMEVHPTVTEAYRAALAEVGEGDRLLVFGSFYTVAEVLTEHV